MIKIRSTALFSAIVFITILFVILKSTPSRPALGVIEDKADRLSKLIPRPQLPQLDSFSFSLFPPAAHKPPEQKNSTHGSSKWYSDWKWQNPFSSSITLDEDRSVLPPIQQRPPIYTFYDSAVKREKEMVQADRELLLAWRRAWFAQGFHPIVLGPADSIKNPLYKEFHAQGPMPDIESTIMEWLAWGSMGTGIFSNRNCFPMAPYDDHMLSYLRKGTIPEKLIRMKGLKSGLLVGEGSLVKNATRIVFTHSKAKDTNNIFDLLPQELLKVEETTSLAFYDLPTIISFYPPVAKKMTESQVAGSLALANLINLHLQTIFLKTFRLGIQVLSPFSDKAAALIDPGTRLATLLSECVPSIMPSSCPPNVVDCQPCQSTWFSRVSHPNAYKNTTETYTIGTLPHPYTLMSLLKGDENVTTAYIRRDTARDPWLTEATKGWLSGGDAASKVVAFKALIAGNSGMARGLWFTTEKLPARLGPKGLPADLLDELDWHFGFSLPRKTKNENNGNEKKPATDENPSRGLVKSEIDYDLIDKARKLLRSSKKEDISIKKASEAWNLGDVEIWRFARAYR
ncbi:hypothetical protein FQN57_003071 [Myotisia sp. PD_48]|nr:hypothetical protein FQN57_003071 [Myotisia sp. PD_48]